MKPTFAGRIHEPDASENPEAAVGGAGMRLNKFPAPGSVATQVPTCADPVTFTFAFMARIIRMLSRRTNESNRFV